MFKIKSLFNSLLKNKALILSLILLFAFLLMNFFNIKEGFDTNSIPSFYQSQIHDNTNPQDIDSTNFKTYNNTVISGFGPLIIRNYDKAIDNFKVYYYYTGPPDVSVTYYDRTNTKTQVLLQNNVVNNNTITINAISVVNGNLLNDHTTIPLVPGSPSGTNTTSPATTSPATTGGSTSQGSTESSSSTGTTYSTGSSSETSYGSGTDDTNVSFNSTSISNGTAIISASG